jgi:hypothetical protein
MASYMGVDVKDSIVRFLHSNPVWLDSVDVTTRIGMARFLASHREGIRFHQIAAQVNKSRHSVGRWFSGQVDVRLSDFLRVLDVVSLRAIDFVACLVDTSCVPCIAEEWKQLESRRKMAAYDPFSQVVLRVLELEAYRNLLAHSPGFVSRRLGVTLADEERYIQYLLDGGHIQWQGKRLVAGPPTTVDTRRDSITTARLKEHWAQTGLDHLKNGGEGGFAYNVFGVSEIDAQRLREMQVAYFHEIRAIVAKSEPTERVYVINLQLFPVDVIEP